MSGRISGHPRDPRMVELIAANEDVGDLDAAPGSRPWAVAVRLRARAALKDERSKAGHLRRLLELLREHKGYASLTDADGAPFRSYEAFCAAPMPFGLGYDIAVIDAIIRERESAEERARRALPLAEPRRPTKEEASNNHDHVRVIGYGNGSDYLTARIARDRPDILERMKAGQFTSGKAAAREAGIVKETITMPRDPAGVVRALCRRFGSDELDEIIEGLRKAREDAT